MASTRVPGTRFGLAESLAAFGALAIGVFSVAFSESVIIATVVALGPLGAFALLLCVFGATSALIAYAFDADEAHRGTSRLVRKAREWIDRKEAAVEARAERLAHLSEAIAFVVLSVTIGPFLTTIAVKLRGGSPQNAYALSLLSSAVFSAVWVSVYAGGLAVIRQTLSG